MKKYYSLLVVVLLSILGINIMSSSPRNEAKGKYYRLKGMEQDVSGNLGEAYSLYRLAYEADPGNIQSAYYYARTSLFVADSLQQEKAFAMMKDFVDTYPSEYEENLFYATLNLTIGNNMAEAMRIYKRLLNYYPENENLLTKTVELAAHTEDADTVLYYIDRLSSITGDEAPYTQYVIGAYLEKEDTTGLIRHIDNKIAERPSHPYYYLIRGILAGLESDDPAEIEKYYLKADSVAPGNFGVKHSLIEFYSEHGDSVKEQKTVYEALLCEDVDPEEKVELFGQYATSLLVENKPTEHTDTMINSLLEQYPYSTEMRSLASDYYYAKQDIPKAIENMEIVVDMDSENMDYRSSYIQLLTAASRYDDAIKVYEQAVNYEHDRPALELMIAAVYNELDMPDKANKVLDFILSDMIKKLDMPADTEILELTDEKIDFYFNEDGKLLIADILAEKGNICFKSKDTDKAMKYYDRALELNDNMMYRNNCAYFMALDGVNIDKAAEMSKTTVDEEPENPVYLDTYAYILFRQGQYAEALKYIEQAIEYAQAADTKLSADYFEHYGDILYKNGKSAEALEQWRKALKLEPSNARIIKKVKAKKYIDEE